MGLGPAETRPACAHNAPAELVGSGAPLARGAGKMG
jgi:hypothetical protein